jgi:hypothetical protein
MHRSSKFCPFGREHLREIEFHGDVLDLTPQHAHHRLQTSLSRGGMLAIAKLISANLVEFCSDPMKLCSESFAVLISSIVDGGAHYRYRHTLR